MRRNAEDMATILAEIYEKKFGGKARGRYQITRSAFTELSGRRRLKDSFVYKVIDACFDEGYILIDLGNNFVVIDLAVTENYRKVPKSIVKEILEEDDEVEDDEYFNEEDDDDEDDFDEKVI